MAPEPARHTDDKGGAGKGATGKDAGADRSGHEPRSGAGTGRVEAETAVNRASALAPLLRQAAPRADVDRRMSDDTASALIDAGMFRLVQPRRFGGLQLGAEVFARCVIELAAADASAGWVASLTSAHTKWAGFFPLEGQEELYGDDGDLRFPLVVAPQGTATPVEGGVVLTGSWDYASGCDICNWLGVNALMLVDGAVRGLVSCVIPSADYRIHDNWYVEAMRGTGSKQAVIDDVFVPTRRVIPMGEDGEPAVAPVLTNPDEGFYRAPMMPLFALELGAVAVGIGRGFLERFSERAQTKISPFPPHPRLRDTDPVQARLARSTVSVDIAETVVVAAAREYDRRAESADPTYDGLSFRRELLAVQMSVLSVTSALESLVTVAGTSVVSEGEALMRSWRDLTAIRTHYLLDSDRTALNLGRLLTGNEPVSRA